MPSKYVLTSLVFGTLIGLMWIGEVVVGNLGDTKVLGSIRTVHPKLYRDTAGCCVLGVLILTGSAGFFGAHQTGEIRTGVQVGFWSGLISGAITLAALMIVTFVFLDALMSAPSNIAEFAGQPRGSSLGFARWLYLDALAGGLNHLWIGPMLGLVIGGAGAILGKSCSSNVSARPR
jgi:hypothetical protein